MNNLFYRMVGGSFDGEYSRKNILRQLVSQLEITEEAKDWYSWDWDKAHILELGVEQGNIASTLFRHVDETVTLITGKFRRGKAYGDIIRAEGANVKAPITFSTTRFAAYHSRVLQNFKSNFLDYYNYMDDSSSPDKRKMESMSFVIGLSVKLDIMTVLGQLSKEAQGVGVSSWRLYDAINRITTELDDMISSINAPNPHPKLVNFKEVIAEVRESSTFCGVRLTMGRDYNVRTRASQAQGDSALYNVADVIAYTHAQSAIFIGKFKEKFQTEVDRNIATASPLITASFKLENVLQNAQNNHVPEEFVQYFRMAIKSGYVGAERSEDMVKEEYKAFCKLAANLVKDSFQFKKDVERGFYTNVEQHVYKLICGSKCKEPIECTVDLLLSAMLRTHCEAAAESMGNIVNNVLGDRKLDFDNLKEEVFLAWNGPHPMNADKLIADTLDSIFDGRDNWSFYRKSKRMDLIQSYTTSEVVDRVRKEAKEKSKIPY
jgi:hypothetical protein